MRVQPQHAQALASGAAVGATALMEPVAGCDHHQHNDGHAPGLQLGVHGIVRRLVPGQAFGVVAQALRVTRATGVGRAGQVPNVLHVHTKARQGPAQLGHPQGIGAVRPAQRLPHIGGACANQGNGLFRR